MIENNRILKFSNSCSDPKKKKRLRHKFSIPLSDCFLGIICVRMSTYLFRYSSCSLCSSWKILWNIVGKQ